MVMKSLPAYLFLLSALSALVPGGEPGGAPAAESIDRAVAAVYPALVRIAVVMEEGDDGRMKKQQGIGSGSIISADGYVLTNHHVAGRGTRFVCTLSNHEEVDATFVGTDVLADLAVIKLDLATRRNPGTALSVAKFGDSDKLKVGDVVLAMGSPGGLSQSVTKGIVANRELIAPKNMGNLELDGENVGELVRWIGHDAVIYGGNSGGPLVNLDGEIVGVNEVGIASLGGAIPSNLAKSVSAELIAKGSISRSWIGVEAQPLLRGMAKEKGALVATVLDGSPAKDAGMKPGDFITEYSGQVVPDCFAEEDLPRFNAMVLNTPIGAKITIRGVRAGQPQTWELNTVKREPNRARESELRGWGLTVRNLTRVSALEKHRENTRGVLVDTVRPGGPCSEAKPALRKDDVVTKFNGEDVANVDSLVAATKEFTRDTKVPKPALVTFERGRDQLITVVKVGPEPDEQLPKLPEKAWLGASVQVLSSDLATALKMAGKKGVRVTRIAPASPAANAGIRPGDLFLKLDGQVINASRPEDDEVFANLIRAYDVGASAEFDGLRDGQPIKVTVTLGRRPKEEAEIAQLKDDRFEFTAKDLSVAQRLAADLDDKVQGVLIDTVIPSGWAAIAGLRGQDILLAIDGEAIPDVATLKRKLAQLSEAKPRRTVFFILRGIRNLYLEVEPQWQ
jgi:serine protease Do